MGELNREAESPELAGALSTADVTISSCYPGHVVFEGTDKGGKDSVLERLVELLEERGLRFFDVSAFQKEQGKNPLFYKGQPITDALDLSSFDAIVCAEPTYFGVGKTIREQLLAEEDTLAQAEAFAEDRLFLAQQVIEPLYKAGKLILQSRNLLSSRVFQATGMCDGKPLADEKLMGLKGNAHCIANVPPRLFFVFPVSAEEQNRRTKRMGSNVDGAHLTEDTERNKKYDINGQYQSDFVRAPFTEAGSVFYDFKETPAYSQAEIEELIEQKAQEALRVMREHCSLDGFLRDPANFYKKV